MKLKIKQSSPMIEAAKKSLTKHVQRTLYQQGGIQPNCMHLLVIVWSDHIDHHDGCVAETESLTEQDQT